MLYVRLTTAFSEDLGELQIRNDGTGDADVGNYDVWLVKDGGEFVAKGRVEQYDRAAGPWNLVAKAIRVLGL